jgi:hypothetical protein
MDITKAYCLMLKKPSLETFAPLLSWTRDCLSCVVVIEHLLLFMFSAMHVLCFEFDEEASVRMCVLMGATMVWEISQCDKTKRTNYLAE